MKRSLYAACLALGILLAGCNSTPKQPEDDKGLLPTGLVNNPRSANGQKADASRLPVIAIPDTAHDFGPMRQGETVEHDFAFTNTGGLPLIISGADAGCGCTVTDYPRQPVAPGSGGIFKVKFNSAGKIGHQDKTVTIASNASNGTKHVTITADVAETK